jgi:hypothetical protein
MGHPLTPDLSKLSMDELTNKYNDLLKRYNMSSRWGKPEMAVQLQMIIQDYNGEIQNRNRKSMEELQNSMKNDKDLKKIIDIQ